MDEIKPKKISIIDSFEEITEPEVITPKIIPIENTTEIGDEENLPELVELNKSIKACIKDLGECAQDITKGWGEFTSAEDVSKAINDLFIRFNTSPKVYTKKDYLLLLQLLSKAFTYLYNKQDIITTEWLDPHSNSKAPSEALVWKAIGDVDSSIFATNERLNEEINNRKDADQKVMDDLLPLIYAGL